MWIKKLKQKKLQYFLIALILLCITSILIGCTCFVLGIQQFNQTYYGEDTQPEFYFSVSSDKEIQALKAFDKKNNSFESLFLQKVRSSEEKIKIGNREISMAFLDMIVWKETDEIPFTFQKNGEIGNLKAPKPGTVWISAVFADLKGIKIGDILTFGETNNHTLMVAGTYNSAICPSASQAYYPFYISESDEKNLSDLQVGYFGCFTRNDKGEKVEEFVKKLPKEFLEAIKIQFNLESLRSSYSMANLIMAGIGMAACILIFVVSIIIIRFIIKTNLAKEYKSIGIYKSMGFTSQEIIGFYLKCYLLVGSLGVASGAVLGIPIAGTLGAASTKYLGKFSFTKETAVLTGLAAVGLLFLVMCNVFISLTKIKKMSPVKALNNEMTSSKSRFKRSLIRSAHSPLSMAVNDIFKRKGTSIMIVMMLTVSFYLSIFFTMVNYTGRSMGDHINSWFAIPQADCFVDSEITKELRDKIDHSVYVKDVIYGQLYLTLPVEASGNDKDKDKLLSNMTVVSYSDFEGDITQIHYAIGRAPKGKQEVAFTMSMLQNLEMEPGDYIRLRINREERDYLITGGYDSMMNGGLGLQISNDALDECGVSYKNDIAFVTLKDKADFAAFKSEISEEFSNIEVAKELDIFIDATKGVTEIIVPITIILVSIFISFSFLNIINLLLVNNLDNKMKFGVLKALGFTNGYIMKQNVGRILLLSLVSIAAALLLHFTVSAKLFHAAVSVDGLVNDVPLMAGLIGMMLVLIVFTSLVFSFSLRKITPTDLMEE